MFCIYNLIILKTNNSFKSLYFIDICLIKYHCLNQIDYQVHYMFFLNLCNIVKLACWIK